jgi:hypothetical protein
VPPFGQRGGPPNDMGQVITATAGIGAQ